MRPVILLLLISFLASAGTRLKELVSIEGARDNQLVGYGLVVGLNGTGDKRETVFSAQSLGSMLERMGISVPASALMVRNTAGVIVTANLPPFSQPGTRIDVTASAIGDAPNLQGGILVLTPLKAADGQVYAVAQGAVVTGGFVAGRGATGQMTNHPTVGRIPSGAIVEREPPSVPPSAKVKLQLRRPDFSTAARIAEAVNRKFGAQQPPVAQAENSAVVTVSEPGKFSGRHVEFLAEIENIAVDADAPTRVVVNERTGTVVMGKDVRIRPAAILHGGLTVEIRTTPVVSQPAPLSPGGKTTVTEQVSAAAKEEKAKSVMLEPGATVEDLIRALTAIGSTARDIIAILQNLKAAGALEAEIEVI